MAQKTFLLIASMIFLLIALGHLPRIFFKWSVSIGGWAVPFWVNWVAMLIFAFLAAHKRVEEIRPREIRSSSLRRRVPEFLRREWLLFRTSMFFSLMSAFNIGFRDINFGRWLRLLTREEFDIKAVGWARVIAGWQSLINVYFIALWVLTYFGRPFE